jgi:hypothetical protein
VPKSTRKTRRAVKSPKTSKPAKLSAAVRTPAPVPSVKQVVEPLDINTFRDRLMTPEQVSQFLSIPVGTLSNWRHAAIATGVDAGPKHLKVGHSVRYRMADIEAWLAAGGVTPPMPPKKGATEAAAVQQ